MFKEPKLLWTTGSFSLPGFGVVSAVRGLNSGPFILFLFQPPAVSWDCHLCHRLIHLSTRSGPIHGWRGQLQGSLGGVRSWSTLTPWGLSQDWAMWRRGSSTDVPGASEPYDLSAGNRICP